MPYLFALILTFSLHVRAQSCAHLEEDFLRLSQLINDNNQLQANNLSYTGQYLSDLHAQLQTWEGRRVLVPVGQFDFIKSDAQMVLDSAETATTIAKDINGSMNSLISRLDGCIKN